MASAPAGASAVCDGFPDTGEGFVADATTAAGSALCGSGAEIHIRLLNSRGIGDTEGTGLCSGVLYDNPPFNYGDRMIVEMQITAAANPALVGKYRRLYLYDGGTPVSGQPNPDKIYGDPPTTPYQECPSDFSHFPVREKDRLKSGDIDIYPW